MTWECQWNSCGHIEEELIDMCEHQIAKHKDKPKEIGTICIEHKIEQITLDRNCSP